MNDKPVTYRQHTDAVRALLNRIEEVEKRVLYVHGEVIRIDARRHARLMRKWRLKRWARTHLLRRAPRRAT